MRDYKRKRHFDITQFIVIGAIVLVLLAAISPIIIDRATEQTVVVTVTDKAIKRSGDDDIYLIYTDNGTYKITDSVAYWRWDSSDLYGEIEKDTTYECRVAGFRLPFFSEYKNIIEAKEITE